MSKNKLKTIRGGDGVGGMAGILLAGGVHVDGLRTSFREACHTRARLSILIGHTSHFRSPITAHPYLRIMAHFSFI